MFRFALRLVITLPLFVALLGLGVVALALELMSPSRGARPAPLDLLATFVNRG